MAQPFDTHAARIVAELRDLILQGEFAPGQRLVEAALSDRLAASRTPVRSALQTLEQQGLVQRAPAGGYIVRTYTAADVIETITAHAAIEGILARLAAEQGLTRAVNDALQDCLDEGDRIVAQSGEPADAVVEYLAMNARFHGLIVEAGNNRVLADCLERIDQRPFGAVGSMLQSQTRLAHGADLIRFAVRQHAQLVDALRRGQGTHAQAIAESHRRLALFDFEEALALHPDAGRVLPEPRRARA